MYLDKKFASEAAKAGLVNLKGHRSVGGMRASIYNAMPQEGVEKLVSFMKEFAIYVKFSSALSIVCEYHIIFLLVLYAMQ